MIGLEIIVVKRNSNLPLLSNDKTFIPSIYIYFKTERELHKGHKGKVNLIKKIYQHAHSLYNNKPQ